MSQPTDVESERFGLPQTVIDRIVGVLVAFPATERAILCRFRVKGNCRVGSDIDLAIVCSQFTEEQMLERETRPDDLLLPYTIDITRFESTANPDLIEHTHRVERTFYEWPHGMGGEP